MNTNDLTIGQAKELSALFQPKSESASGLNRMIGEYVIVRTYSAGVWAGELSEKSGNEVILKNARRMWRWQAAESISLSAVAVHGIDRSKSSIVEAVNLVWLEAIEIIPTSKKSQESINGAENVKAK